MIIWLSSYPKSGNTWLRFFILSLLLKDQKDINLKDLEKIKQFPTKAQYERLNIKNINYENLNEISNYWERSQEIINQNPGVKFFKTHNALCKIDNNLFTNEENTLGVIYIVRDPRNVITSLNNHFHHENIEQSKKFLFDERKGTFNKSKYLANENFALPQVIGSWRTHYKSWKLLKKNYLLIKYENLIADPVREFTKVYSYLERVLKIKISEKKFKKAIELSRFERLREIEEKDGFSESVLNSKTGKKEKFFYLGPKNNWEKVLDRSISDEICKEFETEMKELEYI